MTAANPEDSVSMFQLKSLYILEETHVTDQGYLGPDIFIG